MITPFSPPNTSTTWHSLSVEDTVVALSTHEKKGLTAEESQRRRQIYGANQLQEAPRRSRFRLLLDQFANIMLLMLLGVALVSAILDLLDQAFPKDAIAIFAIILLNAWLGYLQESKAEEALAALKSLSSPKVRVIRDGQEIEIEAPQLVPGDVMLMEAGVQIPADGRLVQASDLSVRESALTGEATAVSKQAQLVLDKEKSLGDRRNLVYQGTEVLQGRGTAIVTNIGMATELGKIAALLQEVNVEPTPLQQRMTQLAKALVFGSLILVLLVVMAGLLQAGSWEPLGELLSVSLSMAVAVVPEGLPAVITVTLALGTQRMVRRHALIRKLPAVETLGSITTICSDKTGTLTQNKMVVETLQTLDQAIAISGVGYDPTGEFSDAQQQPLKSLPLKLQHLLLTGALCNDAALQRQSGEWQILGDPTEGALLVLAQKGGIVPAQVNSQWLRRAEIPFSSERKRMSVFCEPTPDAKRYGLNAPIHLFSKGSPELLLPLCEFKAPGEALTPTDRDRILADNNRLASQGLRILGLAHRALDALPLSDNLGSAESDLTWLGLVAMMDAPRPEALSAVELCRQAGIRPVMITGDHRLTAQAIAQKLGIAQPDEPILEGAALEKLSDLELLEQVATTQVYARVAPAHKLRIVRALQQRQAIVAMTGDGVNDAPALKQANIGIAMGITGTDVSKEASDMVLLDDNFASIVAAAAEGRVIYSNIRRFIKYILGSNVGEVITIAAAPLIGLGTVPLSPLQILWMNLVTDGLPALALALEPAEPDVMKVPPHDPQESIFARGLGLYIIRIGIILSILTIGLMTWAYGYTHADTYDGNPETWKTIVFTTLCMAQMGHALAVRSDRKLTLQLDFWSNPYLLGAIALTTGLQLLLIYIPFLHNFFGVYPLSPLELAICFGVSALMFTWVELEKFLHSARVRRGKRSVAAD